MGGKKDKKGKKGKKNGAGVNRRNKWCKKDKDKKDKDKKWKNKEKKEQIGKENGETRERTLNTGDPEMDELLTGYLIDTVNELFEDKRRAIADMKEREKKQRKQEKQKTKEEKQKAKEEKLKVEEQKLECPLEDKCKGKKCKKCKGKKDKKGKKGEEKKGTIGKEEKDEKEYGPEPYDLTMGKKTRVIKFTKCIETLSELLELADYYDPSVNYDCVVNMERLRKCRRYIEKLNNMVGLSPFKRSILDQILYILTLPFPIQKQDFPMLHCCLYGPPGVGKTQVAKILGKIYANLGLLEKGHVNIVKREDFVGEYLGSSALKTRRLLEGSLGGVLLIDEVYSFGSEDRKSNADSYAKEAVDCLNVFLSEHATEFICIIAGYKDAIQSCFFSINQGLARRFTTNHELTPYTPSELSLIFQRFMQKKGVSLPLASQVDSFFKEREGSFPHWGGDVKTFVEKIMIYKGRRRLVEARSQWSDVTVEDMRKGMEIYTNEKVKKESNEQYKTMFV